MAKNYSVNMEDGEVVSVVMDGVVYTDPDQIPDEEVREEVIALMAGAGEDLDEAGEAFDKEFEQQFEANMAAAAARPFDVSKVVFRVFLGVTFLVLAVFLVSSFFAFQAMTREDTTQGRIVEMLVQRDNSGRPYAYPVIEFTLPDNTIRTVQSYEGSWPPAYEAGQQVTVRYDPGPPLRARVDSGAGALGMWVLPLITGVLGLAFLGATLFARWMMRQSPTVGENQTGEELL